MVEFILAARELAESDLRGLGIIQAVTLKTWAVGYAALGLCAQERACSSHLWQPTRWYKQARKGCRPTFANLELFLRAT